MALQFKPMDAVPPAQAAYAHGGVGDRVFEFFFQLLSF